MSLFGPPNVDNYRKKGKIEKLVGLITNKDQRLASTALEALLKISDDSELEDDRKKFWISYSYLDVFKKIEKLDLDKQKALKNLTDKLTAEKVALDKRIAIEQQEREELIKRFEKSFGSLYTPDKDFFNNLLKILGKNKKFIHTIKLPGERVMSSFSGVIVTIDKIIYFELNVFSKVRAIRFDNIKEIKFRFFKTFINIISKEGNSIEIHIDEDAKEMTTYIEEYYQKIKMSN